MGRARGWGMGDEGGVYEKADMKRKSVACLRLQGKEENPTIIAEATINSPNLLHTYQGQALGRSVH